MNWTNYPAVAVLVVLMLVDAPESIAADSGRMGSMSHIGFRVEEMKWETGGTVTVFRAKVAHIKQRDDWIATVATSPAAGLAIRISPEPAYSSNSRVLVVSPSREQEPDSDFDLQRSTLIGCKVVAEKKIRTAIFAADGRPGGGTLTALPGMTQYVGVFAPAEPNDPMILTVGFPDIGAGYRLEIGLNTLPPLGFPSGMLGLLGTGSEVQVAGEVKLATLKIKGDPEYPLSFKLMRGRGFVRLFGRGVIQDETGKTWKTGENDSVKAFSELLRSKNSVEREIAAGALGWLAKRQDDKDAIIPLLRTALSDGTPEVRRNAVEALGRLNGRSARVDIESLLQDPDDWVKALARQVVDEFAKP